MRFLWLILFLSVATICAEGKRKRKFEGDFEFADEVESKSNQKNIQERKKWIHDPNSELCKPLNCKKKEICLLDETFAAFCVSKKEIHKNGDVTVTKVSKVTEAPSRVIDAEEGEEDGNDDGDDDDDDDDIFYDSEDGDADSSDSVPRCKTCPIVKPVFLCGSDNRTYSSLCRLDYHNCLHRSHVKVSCKGFCPCKAETEIISKKKQKQSERMNSLMAKFQNSFDKSSKSDAERKGDDGTYGGVEKARRGFRYGGKAVSPGTEKKKYRLDKYSYVPEEFRYDNKHYKYIKYKKYSKDLYGNDDKSHNEVIETKPGRAGKVECSAGALRTMGDRLLDWFSVVMAEGKRRKESRVKVKDVPGWCKAEVGWMFGYLDLDGDGKLSLQELYRVEHDHAEKCAKPFVDGCDSDRDIFISPKEWCRCFEKAEGPCGAAKRRISSDSPGVSVPDCDGQGYFRPIQCHTSTGLCWCVDRHGIEFANTRTRGRPDCDETMKKSKGASGEKDEGDDDGDEDEGDDDDDDDENGRDDDSESDMEGSADQPLDF